MRNKFYFLLFYVFSLQVGFSQTGFPLYYNRLPLSRIPVFELPAHLVQASNETPAPELKVYQVGIPVGQDLNLKKLGLRFKNPDGSVASLLRIRSRGATHLNLIFSGLSSAENSALYAYAPDGSQLHRIEFIENGQGASIPISGEEIVLEYNGTLDDTAAIHIDWIVHGTKDFWKVLRDYQESGACNVNVNCPQGADWAAQASAVVLMLTSTNSRFCTGTLINNSSRDGTPYILTAAHCNPASTDLFMFNYQSPGCSNQDGPLDQVIQGCKVRATSPGTDFCLAELNRPPENFNTFLSGWDKSGTVPTHTTVIHHPEGDIKKISSDNHPAGTAPYLGAMCWEILHYESGTTESGSSGSPLFNPEKLIIGQLYGGYADCSFPEDDYYGKFSLSWLGNNASERLHDWLDPQLQASDTLSGMSYSFSRQNIDLRLVQVTCLPDEICGEHEVSPLVEIKNMGLNSVQNAEIQYQYNQGAIQTLSISAPLAPLGTRNISIAAPQGSGDFTLKVWLSSTQPGPDSRAENDTLVKRIRVTQGYTYKFSIFTDERSNETSFRLLNNNQQVLRELPVASLGDEAEFNFYFCLPPGCYTIVMQDQGGNGICCNHGNGAYYLSDPFDQIIATGGPFGNEQQVNFCVDSLLLTGDVAPLDGMTIFPIPAKNEAKIFFKGPVMQRQIIIRELSGRIVKTLLITADQVQLDLSSFSPGLYLVSYVSGTRIQTGKFLVN